jgi:hypothetical protein
MVTTAVRSWSRPRKWILLPSQYLEYSTLAIPLKVDNKPLIFCATISPINSSIFFEIENSEDCSGFAESGASIFRGAPRSEWESRLAHLDVCFAPVLSFDDASRHPHLVARGTYVDVDGIPQPAPAPRFDRTAPTLDRPPAPPGHHTDEILGECGFSADEIEALRMAKAVG